MMILMDMVFCISFSRILGKYNTIDVTPRQSLNNVKRSHRAQVQNSHIHLNLFGVAGPIGFYTEPIIIILLLAKAHAVWKCARHAHRIIVICPGVSRNLRIPAPGAQARHPGY